MKKERRPGLWYGLGIILTVLVAGSAAYGQEINLDKFERSGDLLCFQSLKDPNVFYYLPDRPRLAVKDGRPQFSFLKYARTKETGEAGTNRAEGGGVVHFLVTYGADKGRVRAAERALQEKHPDAKIAGPIMYRKGSFALITSFKEGAETLTKTVAVGRAPLMEGQKAAVSMALTREGAELLWESFKGATPDISLVFDMEFAGVREPYEATLEADWERISKHKRIQAGAKYKWFGVDVDLLFQEMRQTGAIKITTKGEDATMDKILESANAKLLSVMFDPAPDELSRMAAEKGSYDNLNQAVKMLKDDAALKKTSCVQEAPSLKNWPTLAVLKRALNALVPEAYAADQAKEERAKILMAQIVEMQKKYWLTVRTDDRKAVRLSMEPFFLELRALRPLSRETTLKIRELCDFPWAKYKDWFPLPAKKKPKKRSKTSRPSTKKKDAENTAEDLRIYNRDLYIYARQLDDKARESNYKQEDTEEALQAYEEYLSEVKPTGERAKEVEGRIRYLRKKLEEKQAAGGRTDKDQGEQHPSTDEKPAEKKPTPSEEPTKKDPDTLELKPSEPTPAKPKEPKATTEEKTTPTPSTDKPAEKKQEETAAAAKAKPKTVKSSPGKKSRKGGSPGFSLVASYKMKKIKRSGKMVYQMNHYRNEMQAFAMTENIGDLYRRYGNDRKVFRAVNIDDPVFKQREILVTLDGQDSETFSRHMNFVTVQMRKRHQSGKLTTDEVAITPEKFNESGNAFILSYGWKGDDDRTAWLDYDVEALWSFHGGMEIRVPWTTHNTAMLALQPSHRYRTITVEGEGDALTEAQVRHAVVTLKSFVDGKPVSTQATIRNQGPAPSLILDIPEERDGPASEVSITWYLKGGKTLTAEPHLLEGDIFYWDELPEKGI